MRCRRDSDRLGTVLTGARMKVMTRFTKKVIGMVGTPARTDERLGSPAGDGQLIHPGLFFGAAPFLTCEEFKEYRRWDSAGARLRLDSSVVAQACVNLRQKYVSHGLHAVPFPVLIELLERLQRMTESYHAWRRVEAEVRKRRESITVGCMINALYQYEPTNQDIYERYRLALSNLADVDPLKAEEFGRRLDISRCRPEQLVEDMPGHPDCKYPLSPLFAPPTFQSLVFRCVAVGGSPMV